MTRVLKRYGVGMVKTGSRDCKLFGLTANIFEESSDLESKRSSWRSIVEKSFAMWAAALLTSRLYVASSSGSSRMSMMRLTFDPYLIKRVSPRGILALEIVLCKVDVSS